MILSSKFCAAGQIGRRLRPDSNDHVRLHDVFTRKSERLVRVLRSTDNTTASDRTSAADVHPGTRGLCLAEIAGFTLPTDGAWEPVPWPAELADLREAFRASNDGTFQRGLDLLVGASAAAIESDGR